MISLLSTVFTVFGYILFGFILKKINIISNNTFKFYNFISFNILLPIVLITYFWNMSFPKLINYNFLIVFFGAGITIFIIGFYIGKIFFYLKTDDCALFGLSSCFGNSVAFGIPLMVSILGPIDVMPYMILVLFHGLVHFTYTTVIIEGYRNRKLPGIKLIVNTLLGLLKNIILFGMFIGFFLNTSNIEMPNTLKNILIPLSHIALPALLISLGIAIGEYKIIHNISHSIILTGLKNIVYPILACCAAKFIFFMPQL
jgi:predicted permease